MHAYTNIPVLYTTETRTHENTFKAKKDIAAGQEILAFYGGADWFERRNIPYADVDYASTMWRPSLHPLPCRQNVYHATEADGRHSFAVLANTIQSGTILEISLCVEVALNVVDQFPILWDFVINDATTQTVCVREAAESCWQHIYSSKQIYQCQFAQVCVPLSYAAQIPTTPNPDRANVRVSLTNLDHDVRKCSATCFCMCLCACARAAVCVYV